MILPIVKEGDEMLRRPTEPVRGVTPFIRKLASDMVETMHKAGGVGLAAPQVGKSLKMIVVDTGEKDVVLLNPEIVLAEGEFQFEEGCLSIPDKHGIVKRYGKVVVRALNLNGIPVQIQAENNLLCACLQHEIDHLDGILYIDKLIGENNALLASK